MNIKVISFLCRFVLLSLVATLGYGCKGDNPDISGGGDAGEYTGEVKIVLPAFIEIVDGEPCTLQQTRGVTVGNIVQFVQDGDMIECRVTEADDSSFTFKLPDGFQSGIYKFYIKRGSVRSLVGSLQINMVDEAIPPKTGSTVYGKIKTEDGTPVKGVVVSDGVITTTTDDNGLYYLESNKSQKVVFYTVPSGYEPQTKGVFPQVYQQLVLDKDIPECHSFIIKKLNDNQENFKILFLGDMHLANRNSDLVQFKTFAEEVREFKVKHAAEHVYAITLGDMSHDKYWEQFNFGLPQYINTINTELPDYTIYHTIGNHDHDPKAVASNLDAVGLFNIYAAPAWYSFNIGKVHFVVMDNIDCSAYDGVSMNYTQGLYGNQHTWLENDLKHVSKDTPVYIMTHAPIFSDSNTPDAYVLRNYGYDKTMKILNGREVHFVNAHLHEQYTMMPKDSPVKNYGHPVYQHNIAAVCACWWYPGLYNRDCLVCEDGTPAGYAIFDFNGSDVKWLYKGTKRPESEQFHVYDMNNVDFSYAVKEFKNLTNKSVINEFTNRYVIPYADGKFKNKVMINAWSWNSECKLEVKTKDGKVLPTTRYKACDPFAILALIPHWDATSRSSLPPAYAADSRYHFFVADCPDADTDIVVTFTDKFGNVFKQEIQRPYAFNLDQFRANK